MTRIVEERKEIRRVLQRLSPKNLERLRNYAVHLEIEETEEKEPPLASDEEAESASYETGSVYGSGHLHFYRHCLDVLDNGEEEMVSAPVHR